MSSFFFDNTEVVFEKMLCKGLNSVKHAMKPIGLHNYFVYITTNKNRNVLYIELTNDLDKKIF